MDYDSMVEARIVSGYFLAPTSESSSGLGY
jgi:hypothetical protein